MDNENHNMGTLNEYTLRFGTGTEGIGSNRDDDSPWKWGLDFYTGDPADPINPQPRMHIANGGNVGIGTTAPQARLHGIGKIAASASVSAPYVYVDEAGINTGSRANSIRFGGDGSGEAIASRRTAGPGQFGLDFYTGSADPSSSQYAPDPRMHIANSGWVGIGTITPHARMQVACNPAPNFTTPTQRVFSIVPTNAPNGGQNAGEAVFAVYNNGFVYARDIRVEPLNPWPDYVFQEDYELMTLDSLRAFIRENGHLPGVPSAAEVEQEGISVSQMNAILLRKLEEMTLYILMLEQERRTER